MTRIRELITAVRKRYPGDLFYADFEETCRIDKFKRRSILFNHTLILFSVALSFTFPADGQRAPVEAEGRGFPWVNLSDASPVAVDSRDQTPLAFELNWGGYRPLTLDSADFNEDGVLDLLCGFAASDGGFLSLHPGTGLADQPFQRSVHWTELPEAPDFLACCDFGPAREFKK